MKKQILFSNLLCPVIQVKPAISYLKLYKARNERHKINRQAKREGENKTMSLRMFSEGDKATNRREELSRVRPRLRQRGIPFLTVNASF